MCDTEQKNCEVSNTSFTIICILCRKVAHEGGTIHSLRAIYNHYARNLVRSDYEKKKHPRALKPLHRHVESDHPEENADRLRSAFKIIPTFGYIRKWDREAVDEALRTT